MSVVLSLPKDDRPLRQAQGDNHCHAELAEA